MQEAQIQRQYSQLGAGMVGGGMATERAQSAVSQTMSILYNRLNDAKANFEDLAAQLTPVRRESPTSIGKAAGLGQPEPGPSCPMDAELMDFARRAQELLDRICEVKNELRI